MTNVPRGDLPPTWKTFPAKFYAPSIISPINSLEYRSTEFLLYPLNIQIIEYFNSMLFLLFVSRVENFLKISGILSFLGRGKDFFSCIFRGKMAALLRFIAPFEEQRRVVSEEEALHRPGEKKRASLFFFFTYRRWWTKHGERTAAPPCLYLVSSNPRLQKRRIPPGRILPFDLPCPTVAPRLGHGNGSRL